MAGRFNNEKNDKQPASVNTFSYLDKNYETGTALAVKFFGNMCSVSIHLVKEDDKSDPPAFDYDHGVTAYLTAKDSKLTAKTAYKSLSKYEDGANFKPVSIPLKKGVMEILTVGDLSKKLKALTGDVGNPSALCCVIYTDLNEKKIPQSYLVHVFTTPRTLEDYRPESGDYKLMPDMCVECDYFLESLKDFAKGMTGGLVHAILHNTRFMRDRWEKNMYELFISLGLDMSKPMGKSSGQKSLNWGESSGSNGIDSRTPSGTTAEFVPADEENIDDIIKSMTGGNNEE